MGNLHKSIEIKTMAKFTTEIEVACTIIPGGKKSIDQSFFILTKVYNKHLSAAAVGVILL